MACNSQSITEGLTVGLLALQGCVEPHVPHFQALGIQCRQVRNKADMVGLHGLVIPGGESTTHLKLINLFGLEPELLALSEKIPFWGICAGAIYLSKHIAHSDQHSLGLVDIEIARNAYGRQIESFSTEIAACTVPFIRAPKIEKILSSKAQVLASYKESPVWVAQGQHMVTTFHPELSLPSGSPFHRYFAEAMTSKMRALSLSVAPAKG